MQYARWSPILIRKLAGPVVFRIWLLVTRPSPECQRAMFECSVYFSIRSDGCSKTNLNVHLSHTVSSSAKPSSNKLNKISCQLTQSKVWLAYIIFSFFLTFGIWSGSRRSTSDALCGRFIWRRHVQTTGTSTKSLIRLFMTIYHNLTDRYLSYLVGRFVEYMVRGIVQHWMFSAGNPCNSHLVNITSRIFLI